MTRKIPFEKTCDDCGAAFMAVTDRMHRCRACQEKATHEGHLRAMRAWARRHSAAVHVRRACRECGKEFTAKTSRNFYCSPNCQLRANRARFWARNADRVLAKRKASRDAKKRKREEERELERLERKARRALHAAASRLPKVRVAKKRKRAAPKDAEWMRQVEFDLQIADPTERFEASQKWSPRQRAYAQKCALRAIDWKGAAY